MYGIGDHTEYGGWLEEDLVDLKRELKFSRDRSEEYSDRADINYKIAQINAELEKRK
jgi:hypothetical protein